MDTFPNQMAEYRKQLEKGVIQKAYRGLLEYILALRTRLQNKYPAYFVSGSLYAGYMDMTYFAFTPPSLQERKLKIAIVFNHDAFRFEVWLGGANKKVQQETWQRFKECGWDRYPVVASTQGMDAIVEHVLAEAPDFRDLEALSGRIERETLRFIREIETFLAQAVREPFRKV
jgi:hypothetical protein